MDDFEWLFVWVMGAGVAFLVLGPPLFLLLGRRALLRGRHERAGNFATVAVISSWFLFPFTAVLGVHLSADGHVEPRAAAFLLLLYPGALWYLGSKLAAAVRRKREEAAAAARGVDRT